MKECDLQPLLEKIRDALRTVEYGRVTIEINADAKHTAIVIERREKVPKR